MTTIIDRAAGFRGFVHSAEVLPLGRPHFGAGGGGAGRGFAEEGDEEVVGAEDEEAGEFVEPEVAVDGWGGRVGELAGGGGGDGVGGVVVVVVGGGGGVGVEGV